jgi:hypothetical protein
MFPQALLEPDDSLCSLLLVSLQPVYVGGLP